MQLFVELLADRLKETTNVPPFDGIEEERHPSFATLRVNKSRCTPGASLFDSEILHREVVTLTLTRAVRRREVNRDWIFATEQLAEVRMSAAQWAAVVSSFGDGSGVPVTLEWFDGESIDSPPFEPRLGLSIQEVRGATDKMVGEVTEAVEALRASFDAKAGRKEMAERLRDLEITLGNLPASASYTAQTFTEHVENTVTKAKSDIEAMVARHAEVLGIGPEGGTGDG